MDTLIVGTFLFSFTAMLLSSINFLLLILDKHMGGKWNEGMEIEGNYRVNWNKEGLVWLAGDLYLAGLKPYVEVIGNVWEYPELLEESWQTTVTSTQKLFYLSKS